MARVKIKHNLDPRDPTTKQKLLEILAKTDIHICNLADTRDGGIVVVTAREEDADSLLSNETVKALKKEGYEPLLPPEVRTRRSILCHGVDQLIYDHTKSDIEDEIEEKNTWARVKQVYKFPANNRTTYTFKIEFEDVSMAAKAETNGLRLFNMSIAYHQIKREIYTPIKTCLRCYKIEDHNTSECPQPRDYKICSECSSQDHTWRSCKSNEKKCLNCNQAHRTMAMICPKRKEAIKRKRSGNVPHPTMSQGSYAQAANRQPPPPQYQTPIPNMEDIASKVTKMLFCVVNAHLMNAVNPGTYQEQLDYLTSSNNLPRMVGPQNPPSADIVQQLLNNNIPSQHNTKAPGGKKTNTTRDNTPAQEKTPKQTYEDNTTTISNDSSEDEEENDSDDGKEQQNSAGEQDNVESTRPKNTNKTNTTTPTRTTQNIHRNKHTMNHKEGTQHKTKTQTTKQQHNSQSHNITHLQTTNTSQDQGNKETRDPRLRLRIQ